MNTPEQERIWLEQALNGDAVAFGKLVEIYQTPVYNLTMRMLGNPIEAEEAAQDTFLKAYTRLKTFDVNRKFSTWILSIASHQCIDRLRRRRFVWLSIEDNPKTENLVSENSHPFGTASRHETRDEIQQVVDRLEPNYRLPLILRYWYDLSYEEIAATLGITEQSVKSRLHRARLQISDQLKRTVEAKNVTQNFVNRAAQMP